MAAHYLLLLAWWGAVFVSGQALHELAVESGQLLFFGTATDTNTFSDEAYMTVLNQTGQFGLVVPENSEKWDATEPTEDQFKFAQADEVLRVAKANQQMKRCHALTWHSQLPAFVSQGTWTRETLTAVIQTHIANVVGHFKGECYSWDVVNEALADSGQLRDSVFSRTLGEDFIPISFRAAAAADPDAKLYYNDFGIEFNSAKTDGAVKIVSDLQAAGVRIDGVGLQSHFEVGNSPSEQLLSTVLRRFTAMGLEVALTELDIRHAKVPASAQALQQQARDYAGVVRACVFTEKCVGVVVWEFSDKYSWIPSTFPGTGEACLFDENMEPKPAFRSVAAVLQAAVNGRNSSNATAKASSLSTLSSSSSSLPSPLSGSGGKNASAQSASSAAGGEDSLSDEGKAPIKTIPSSSGVARSRPLGVAQIVLSPMRGLIGRRR